jgi:hypothetical protein
MAQGGAIVAANARTSRRRRVLSGVALVLACVSILVTTVAIWTHQVALNTDRFTALVDDVIADPAVTDPISARISTQVVDALGVGTRLEARLPDALKPLANTLTIAVRDAIDERLRVALQDPRMQAALVGTVSFTHAQTVRLLRGETDVLTLVDGYLTLNVFPLVGAALTELQSTGLIPADVQLPDLTAPEAPEVVAQRLETALGVTLPPDFGTIQLMPAERLTLAQSVIRVFDLVVVLLVILTVILVAVTLGLARDRRRMLIFLGIGTIIAFLIARMTVRTVEDAIVGGIADGDVAIAMRSMVDATLGDLRSLTVLVLIATVVVVIAAYLWGRPTWVTATASYVGDAAGRAGSAAGAAASTGLAPDRQTVERTVRGNRPVIERIGLAAIVFLLVWLAIGLEVALLGAALVVAFEFVLRALSSGPESAADDARADSPPTVET